MHLHTSTLITLLLSTTARLAAASALSPRDQIHTFTDQTCYTHVADTSCAHIPTVTKTATRETDQCSAVVTYTPVSTVFPGTVTKAITKTVTTKVTKSASGHTITFTPLTTETTTETISNIKTTIQTLTATITSTPTVTVLEPSNFVFPSVDAQQIQILKRSAEPSSEELSALKIRAAKWAKRNDLQQRAAKVDAVEKREKKAQYPSEVVCTATIDVLTHHITTKTAHATSTCTAHASTKLTTTTVTRTSTVVTGSAIKTITAPVHTVESTVVKTVTSTVTSATSATITIIAPTASLYAACSNPLNLLSSFTPAPSFPSLDQRSRSPLRRRGPVVSTASPSKTNPTTTTTTTTDTNANAIILIDDNLGSSTLFHTASSATECCNLCFNTPNCGGSNFDPSATGSECELNILDSCPAGQTQIVGSFGVQDDGEESDGEEEGREERKVEARAEATGSQIGGVVSGGSEDGSVRDGDAVTISNGPCGMYVYIFGNERERDG